MKTLIHKFTDRLNIRTAAAVLLGNIILGIGVALLKLSTMGNDPYTAFTLTMSSGLHMGLGNFQLMLNLGLFIILLIFGRKYLGFGMIVNMCLLGYIVQFSHYCLENVFGSLEGSPFILRLFVMLLALVIASFGLAMYQTADLGVDPYDFLALGMTDALPTPYFVNRVVTDGTCVVLILIAAATGFVPWSECNLGIGTVLCAFGLGPVINIFMPWNRKWILQEKR